MLKELNQINPILTTVQNIMNINNRYYQIHFI